MKIKHFSEDNLEKRATPRDPSVRILVECDVCGNQLIDDDLELQENFCPCCGQAQNWNKTNILLPKIKEFMKKLY